MTYDSQYNGAPNGYGYQPGPAQTLEIKRREKRQIRKLGNISGLGILLFALFQFIGAGLLFALRRTDVDFLHIRPVLPVEPAAQR